MWMQHIRGRRWLILKSEARDRSWKDLSYNNEEEEVSEEGSGKIAKIY